MGLIVRRKKSYWQICFKQTGIYGIDYGMVQIMIYGLDYGSDYVLDYDIDYGIDLSQIYTQKLLLCNYLNQNPNPNTQN